MPNKRNTRSFNLYERKIRKLTKENRLLKEQLRRLKNSHAGADPHRYGDKESTPQKSFYSRAREARLLLEDSYSGYLKMKILSASSYSLWQRSLTYFRRFRLVSTVISVISSSLAVVGTGAFIVVFFLLLIAAIPALLIIGASTYLSLIPVRKQLFNDLEKRLGAKDIYVIFPERDDGFRSAAFFGRGSAPSSGYDATINFVIIISPYFFSGKGLRRGRYYSILRYEAENICIVRKSAFFTLKRASLSDIPNRISFIF